MTREWSGAEEAKGARGDEEDGMLLSGDGDAVGSLWMAMASGGEDEGGARRSGTGRILFFTELQSRWFVFKLVGSSTGWSGPEQA